MYKNSICIVVIMFHVRNLFMVNFDWLLCKSPINFACLLIEQSTVIPTNRISLIA